jgi:hypothetical protein
MTAHAPFLHEGKPFMTWRVESGVPLADCKNDLPAPAGFETYATFTFMATEGPVLRSHCGLHTDVYTTRRLYEYRPRNSKILSEIIDSSYHGHKFRIIVERFFRKF